MVPYAKKIATVKSKPVEWGPTDEWFWSVGFAYEHTWWGPQYGGDPNAFDASVEAVKRGWRPAQFHIFVANWMGWEFVRLLEATGLTKEQVRKLRPHAIHFEWIDDPALFEALADWGVIASVGGPGTSWSQYPPAVFGFPPETWPGFPTKDNHVPGLQIKTMLEKGMKVALESDNESGGIGPELHTPWNLLELAVTREWHTKIPYGGGWLAPEQAIDRVVGLKMQTTWASEFILQEDKLGTLEKGKLADFLVLNQDVLTVPAKEIHNTKPVLTVIDGKIRYSDGTVKQQ